MTFTQQMFATFFGSISGFIFAIFLFHLTEKIKDKRQNTKLIAGLKKEFQYNYLLIDKWIDETDQILRKIASGDHNILIFYRLTDFQRTFINLCFMQGIIYDALDPKDISDLNSILNHFDQGTTQWLNGVITQWREGQLEAPKANPYFEFQRAQLKTFKEQLINISKSII